MGDNMERKKPYSIHFVHNGKDPDAIVKDLVKTELKKVLDKNNAIAYNLEEIVNKYVSGDMCNEQKKS